MSTISTALTFARAQAQTDINGLSDTTGILYANEALVDFHRRLVADGVDASQLQESYIILATPATGTGMTALYPTDMLALKTIEVNYTDTSAQNYRLANQVDVSNIPGWNSFSELRVNQSTMNPLFDDRGDWYEIFPAQSCIARIFYYLKPTEYTAISDTIAYPESQDYRILGWRIAADYYYSLSKFQEGDMFNLKYEERVKQYISTLGRGSAQPIQATPIQLTGWEF